MSSVIVSNDFCISAVFAIPLRYARPLRGTCVTVNAFILLILLSFGSEALAQNFPPGTAVVGGKPVFCGPVWTSIAINVGDWARAVPANPAAGIPPFIVLDGPIVSQFPPAVQIFVYAHECGHHNVGLNEAAADCWAVKTGRDQGWLATTDMIYLTKTFYWNPGDWLHAPGPVRVKNMWNCYNS